MARQNRLHLMTRRHAKHFEGGRYVIPSSAVIRDAAYYEAMRNSRSMRSRSSRQGAGGYGRGK